MIDFHEIFYLTAFTKYENIIHPLQRSGARNKAPPPPLVQFVYGGRGSYFLAPLHWGVYNTLNRFAYYRVQKS